MTRWEHVTGRPAPAPTEPGRSGLPAVRVTDTPGISRNAALRILGNGVVPQQCAEAVRRLLEVRQVAA